MFTLCLDSLNQQGESQTFCLITPNLEVALAAANKLVSSNYQILRLRLRLDKDRAMILPIESFDGTPMLDDLLSLQQQWEDALVTH